MHSCAISSDFVCVHKSTYWNVVDARGHQQFYCLRLLTHVGFLRQNGLIFSEVFLFVERSKNHEKNIS